MGREHSVGQLRGLLEVQDLVRRSWQHLEDRLAKEALERLRIAERTAVLCHADAWGVSAVVPRSNAADADTACGQEQGSTKAAAD